MQTDPTSLAQGRYRVISTLGCGGMAKVYKTWDERLQVQRAIKVLNANFTRSKVIQERFMTEARTMAKLSHPNIVGVLDIVEDSEAPYIVMELVEGGSLSDWCKRHGPMPPRMATESIISLLAALSLAHEHGIIHRDIKPQNILITRKGVTKVTDFGIAQVQDDSSPSLTRTGSTMGTLGYMAPEQRINARAVDATSDLYATGATLWSMLTAGQPLDLFLMSMGRAPHLSEGIPPVLDAIIARACQYDQADRFPSAQSMTEALREALETLPPDPETPELSSGSPTQSRPSMAPAHTPPPRPVSSTMIPDAHAPSNPTMAVGMFDELGPGSQGQAEASEPPIPAAPPVSEQSSGLTHYETDPDHDIVVASPMPKLLGAMAVLVLLVGGFWFWRAHPPDPPTQDPIGNQLQTLQDPIIEPLLETEPPGGQGTGAETLPTDTKPGETKPGETKTADTEPQGTGQTKPAGTKPHGSKPADNEPQGSKPADTKPADTKPTETKPADTEPADTKPAHNAQVWTQPDPVPPATGTVHVKGDALRVILVGQDGSTHSPGAVPAGSYTVRAAFSDGLPVTAGKITVDAGGSVSLTCSEAFAVCK